MRLLLFAFLVACSSPPPAPEPVVEPEPDQAQAEPTPVAMPASGSLDEVGEDAEDMPFGQALPNLLPDQAQAVFPFLLAAATPADQLMVALPITLGDWQRKDVKVGIQEDELSPWTGAYGTYARGEDTAVILIQDTGWQPTALNRFVRAWRTPDHSLPDGRPVANLPDRDHGGVALHTPVELARPRILIKAWSNTVDAEALVPLLAQIPTSSLLPLLDHRATTAFAPSPLLPPAAELASLTPAPALRAALPASELPVLGEGWGLRREKMRILVTSASRLLDAEGGVIELRLLDLGPADAPVELLATAEESSADHLREDAGEAKLKCKEALGLCKRMALFDDRFVMAVVGPPEAKAEIERLFGAFDPAGLR